MTRAAFRWRPQRCFLASQRMSRARSRAAERSADTESGDEMSNNLPQHYTPATPDQPHVQLHVRDEGHDHGARFVDVIVRRQAERQLTPGQTPDMFRDIGVSADTAGSDGIYMAIV